MHKIPQLTMFELMEMKKKGYSRYLKYKAIAQFDEIRVNQRIVMQYNFKPIESKINTATGKLHKARAESRKGMFTDDADSHPKVVEAQRELDQLQLSMERMKVNHVDYEFTGTLREHKKGSEDTMFLLKVESETIRWFDDKQFDLGNYQMRIADANEWNPTMEVSIGIPEEKTGNTEPMVTLEMDGNTVEVPESMTTLDFSFGDKLELAMKVKEMITACESLYGDGWDTARTMTRKIIESLKTEEEPNLLATAIRYATSQLERGAARPVDIITYIAACAV